MVTLGAFKQDGHLVSTRLHVHIQYIVLTYGFICSSQRTMFSSGLSMTTKGLAAIISISKPFLNASLFYVVQCSIYLVNLICLFRPTGNAEMQHFCTIIYMDNIHKGMNSILDHACLQQVCWYLGTKYGWIHSDWCASWWSTTSEKGCCRVMKCETNPLHYPEFWIF